jgi:hypothetical protein
VREPAEAAENGDFVAMGVEALQRFGIALDKLANRSVDFVRVAAKDFLSSIT